MTGRLIRTTLLMMAFFISLSGQARTVVDSLRERLSGAGSLSDSIVILHKIYDASPYSLQDKTLEELYALSVRRKDYRTVSYVLKLSARHYETDDSMLNLITERAERLPNGNMKRSLLAYLNVVQASNTAKNMTHDQREDKLHELLARQAESENFETYRRIEHLFQLCIYLGMSTEGELLTGYMRELQSLVDKLPEDDLALRYVFYTMASNTYLSQGDTRESVEANRNLLTIIDKLQKRYGERGSEFKDYDRTAFQCYSKLLRCYDRLTDEEIETYYSRIMDIINGSTMFNILSGQSRKPKIFYLMAKRKYVEAIPLIRDQLNDESNTPDEQMDLVEALLKASGEIGDTEVYQMALDMSNAMLRSRIENKAEDSYKDLQTIYKVNDLKETNDSLMLVNQKVLIGRHKERLTFGIICLIVLGVLLVIVFVLYRRSKGLTSNLRKSNALIGNERDAIQLAQKDLIDASDKAKTANRIKNDFVNSLGHEIMTPLDFIVEYSELIADCADAERRPIIKNYSEIVALNADRLLTLVNDVLDLPLLENSRIKFNPVRTSVKEMCRGIIERVKDQIRPGVELVFANSESGDIVAITDLQRVEQVIVNLLVNAGKFTKKGSVTLEYSPSESGDMVIFTVTDTGKGITEDEEQIFSSARAHKDNNLSLYISRLLARMMGGDLTLDKEYVGGARFRFSIPVL